MSGPEQFCTAAVTEEAVGAIAAQQLIEDLQDETVLAAAAWAGFLRLAARSGWRSPACRAYVLELAKRAAA